MAEYKIGLKQMAESMEGYKDISNAVCLQSAASIASHMALVAIVERLEALVDAIDGNTAAIYETVRRSS